MAPSIPITPLADRALILRFGDRIDPAINAQVIAAWRAIDADRPAGVVDLVPAYTTLAVHYDWRRMPDAAREHPWQWLEAVIRQRLADIDATSNQSPRTVTLPVCYESSHAPDLSDLAQVTGLSVEQIVERHQSREYTVACIGFRPGFPYLLGLDPALSMPRLDTPRARVPAGSVAVAGLQTGIYPQAGAGGWRLIGATPWRLFDPASNPPSRLMPGDRVRFKRIDADEYTRLASEQPSAPDEESGDDDDPVLEVLAAGIHSCFQDAGRPGWRHLGVSAGGSFDPTSAALANTLVGNAPGATVLEMAIRGPDLRVLRPCIIALTGAGMTASADGVTLPFGRCVTLPKGALVRFRPTGRGTRAWLAIAGGLRANRWLDSAAVDTSSGLHGRAVQAGDRLATNASMTSRAISEHARWWVDPVPDLDRDTRTTQLRFLASGAAQHDLVDAAENTVWRVSTAADRTGLRLQGAELTTVDAGSRISEAVLTGTIQVPPDGQPIILGPDCQTIGGYPVVGHVIEADLGRLAQCKPGDRIELQAVDITSAHALRRDQVTSTHRQQLAVMARLAKQV